MVVISALVSIILFILTVVLFYFHKSSSRPSNFPPGPLWLPIVGNSPLVKRLAMKHGGFHKALLELARQYKTDVLGLKLGSELFIVVFTKELIRQVSTREEFQYRPDNYFIRLRSMNSSERKGITMTDGEFWEVQRNFATRHLRSLGFGKAHMESLINEELQELIDSYKDVQGVVDLQSHLAPCVLNVLWAFTAGERFPPSDPQLQRLLDLMGARSKAFDMAGGVLSQLPSLAYVAPEWSGYNIICSLNNELKTLLQRTIEEHKTTLDTRKTRDFIDAFIKEMTAANGDPTSFTEDQLVMVCLDLFIAGSQTTSSTLSFAFINMIHHQDVQQRVFNEIKDVLGDKALPSLEDKQRLPLVNAVLLESQRLYHVVPVTGPRRVLYDTKLGHYNVPKNSTVLMSMYSIAHDKETWKEPMKFCPDRFLDENNINLANDLFLFGLGKRRCLGESLAKRFIFLFFVGILRNFELKVPSGQRAPSLEPIPGISLVPKPYKVEIRPRTA